MTKANVALLRALSAGQVSAQTGSVDDSAKAEGGAFAVEPLHTRVLFGVSHFGFTTYYGEFSGVSGALDLDPLGQYRRSKSLIALYPRRIL